MNVIVLQNFISLLIDGLTLLAQYVIVFQKSLTDVEVHAFNSLLSALNGLGNHLGFNGLITQLIEYALYSFRTETDHQFVIQ